MTRNLQHLDLAQLWFKEKVADGTCVIVKVDSKEIDVITHNNRNIHDEDKTYLKIK